VWCWFWCFVFISHLPTLQSHHRTRIATHGVVSQYHLVFQGLVGQPEKRPGPNRTQPIATGPSRTGCTRLPSVAGCGCIHLRNFQDRSKTGCNRLQLVFSLQILHPYITVFHRVCCFTHTS